MKLKSVVVCVGKVTLKSEGWEKAEKIVEETIKKDFNQLIITFKQLIINIL